MSSRLVLLVGLMACIGIGCRDQGAVKLTLSFPNFKPGCIRVSVKDAQGAGEERTMELQAQLAGKTRGGQVTVAAFREKDWGPTLTVTATAFEQQCSDKPVFTTSDSVSVGRGISSAELTLVADDVDEDGYVSLATGGTDCNDREAVVHPGQVELCNGVNDNCDDVVDEGFGTGASCTGELGCGGTVECATTTQATCKVVTSTWYPDQDQDTHGAMVAGKKVCGTTAPGGHVARSDDCDDTKNSVYPGAQELCDTLDNNCNTQTDEDLNVGAACDPGYGCQGIRECASNGGTQCKPKTPPTQYYADNDFDQYGKTDSVIQTCGTPAAGYVLQAGDCNDENRFSHPNAAEVCDREDNDCDNATDEGSVCPSTLAWVDRSSAGTDSWRSVAVWGAGGVWSAGGDKLHLLKPGQSDFQDLSSCTANASVNTLVANPETGDVLLGGNEGFLAQYLPGTMQCKGNAKYAVLTDIKGVTGVLVQNELEIHIVGANREGGPDKGRALRVAGNPPGSIYENKVMRHELSDVHGLSRENLFAVGGPGQAGAVSRIYRFNTSTTTWAEENIPDGTGTLQGVWVVNPKLAYAVGDGGTLFSWNGSAWSKVSNVPNENLSSVVAFGSKSIYVTTLSGEVHHYNGSTWTKVFKTPSSSPLRDIAARHPGDIWVVGDQGKRYHWPQ